MSKIAIIFQGIGYNVDKPLLYYSKKIALEHGYEVKNVTFNGIDKELFKNKKLMLESFQTVISEAESQLKNINFNSYEDIIFISKSIGTVAASVFAEKNNIMARQVYFTPLRQTFSLAQEGNGLIFFGDKDPWIEIDDIRELCNSKKLHFRVIKNANHSLETGKVYDDVENINKIIMETEDYLVGGPIYQFDVPMRDGGIQSMKDYRGKVLLIVNSATGCGFTPQYEALESMYRDFKDKGFEILDFPCDQFGHQAPGSNEQIHSFCTSRYDISFPQFAKICVNGENELELFSYLKRKQGFRGFLLNTPESIYLEKIARKIDSDYLNNSSIKWNFTKFLVNRMGQVIDRFEADAGTEIIRQAVTQELNSYSI